MWKLDSLIPTQVACCKSELHYKSCKDVLLKELDGHLGIIVKGSNYFYPLRHIIYHNKDAESVVRTREWTHEVNPPYIKKFYFKNPTLRHLIRLENVPRPLTSIARHDKPSCILKEYGPVETCLMYFSSGLV